MRSASAACRSRPAAISDAVDRIGPVVDQNPAVERGHAAAGFVHQKVGSRKVPVVAVAAGEAASSVALRRPARAAAPANGCAASATMPAPLAASRSSMRLGPATRAPSRLAPELARIATPLRVAPPPAVARNSSSVAGANSAATHRPAVLDQRHRDRPVVAAGDEGARAVDRIDDPDAARGKPRRIVLAFLRQPAVAGVVDQTLVQQIVRPRCRLR